MTDKAISPLRQRMIEDMTIRKLAPTTQHDCVQRVKNFAAFLGRSPDMDFASARSWIRVV
jgi:integrase/recombinase XerD